MHTIFWEFIYYFTDYCQKYEFNGNELQQFYITNRNKSGDVEFILCMKYVVNMD